MGLDHAIILALIQGITEFLPISSSGHLVLAPYLFGWEDQGLSFDIATNTGSLLAVLVFFRQDVVKIVRGGFRSLATRTIEKDPDARMAWILVLATIPVGLCGLMFKDQVATLARDPMVIATTSILFGILLFLSDRMGARKRSIKSLTWRDAFLIGCAQALALIPGTSRSGVTITAGLFAGFNRRTAARFSFLMTIPVGFLAAGLDFIQLMQTDITQQMIVSLLVGLVVSAISAYLVIGWLLSWLRRRSMDIFVLYRILLGILIFALSA
ncbi:MAG: undecaprenyl-diphosphate phosphatase [Magnetococcales bacterium]|nr:undecaprenyl-diphosphate phosphatase [Magnetococcales bacterium]